MSDDELGSNLDPLDHDGDGRKGGSLKGDKSTRAKGKKVAADDDRVWIVLEDNTDIPPTGLPLSHNGNMCILLPNEPVHIQRKFLNVLDDAVMAAPIIDPVTRQTTGWRDRKRFPYRLVAAPTGE